jgi:hypothetical protein
MRSEYSTRYVYFAHDGQPTKLIKIGMSVTPTWRLKAIRCHMLFAVPCDYRFAHTLERTIHQEFADLRLPDRRTEGGSEWFRVDNRLSILIRTVRLTRRWPFDGTTVVLP